MPDGIFKCGLHKFSTSDIVQWDEHCAELEHEYNVRTECGCGKQIHIKTTVKLPPEARRIPPNLMCDDCKKTLMETSEIKEVTQ